MKLFRNVLVVLLLAVAVTGVERARATVKMAICEVCRVKDGAVRPEEVKAVRMYEGKEYGFCAEKCAKIFDADPAAYVPPAFPRSAPAFAVTDLGGTRHSNASLKGKVVLLDFWATWCAPCVKVMPELQALHRKYADRGFAVVGISVDEGGLAKVKKYVGSKKIKYPIAVDSDKDPAWESFRVKAVPAAFLIDRDGRIVAQWTGVPASATELEAKLDSLLAEN